MQFDTYIVAFLLVLGCILIRTRKTHKLHLLVNGRQVGQSVLQTRGFFSTWIGLLNTPSLNPGYGLLLYRTKAISTCGMHYPIDVIFLGQGMQVLGYVADVAPGMRRLRGPSGTHSILEMGAGTCLSCPELTQTSTKLSLQVASC